jgi:hypothetical protein
MDDRKKKMRIMSHQAAFEGFAMLVRYDIEALRGVIDLAERQLKEENKRLEKRLSQELKKLGDEEARQFAVEWYADDFVRLDEVYPNLQRRGLFLTVMSMLEANLLRTCQTCHQIYEIPLKFKVKKKQGRVIVQAMNYLQKNLTIRDRAFKSDWLNLQHFWTIRNAFVHNNGIPKKPELQEVTEFCTPIPTIEIDHRRRIILKEGSVQMVIHVVALFFSVLIDEIRRIEIPPNAEVGNGN